MKTGIELIAEERQRQIEKEGWTSEHDDIHTNSELADAAKCYVNPFRTDFVHGGFFGDPENGNGERIPIDWPWGPEDWKPTPHDRVKELTKAGALIAAEIDRLQRQTTKQND